MKANTRENSLVLMMMISVQVQKKKDLKGKGLRNLLKLLINQRTITW